MLFEFYLAGQLIEFPTILYFQMFFIMLIILIFEYLLFYFIQRDMDVSELGFKIGETPLDPINKISFGSVYIQVSRGIADRNHTFNNLNIK